MEADSPLVKSRPRISILDFERGEIIDFFREKLTKKGVKSAYLFGSFVKGEANAWSDIDLVIIQETNAPFPERARDYAIFDELGIPVDILVYNEAEFEALRGSGAGFWKEFEQYHLRIV